MHDPTTERQARPPRVGRPVWLAIGVAVGLILAPAAAVAAGVGVTQLVGPSGARAAVARTGQLATVPADPSTWRSFGSYDELGGSGCVKAYTAPAGFSFVLTGLELDTYTDATPGEGQVVSVDVSEGRANPCEFTLMDLNPGSVGIIDAPISPGFVIPPGQSLYTDTQGTVAAEMFGQGYLVPAADAPHETPLTQRVRIGSSTAQKGP